MLITFFFRKPSPVYHSIENLFHSVIKEITDYDVNIWESPFPSTGIINRIKIGLSARKHKSEINHITGDIHFIALFLKKKSTILTIHDIGILKEGSILKRFIIGLFWFNLPIKKVKYVTVISEFTKQELIKKFKVKPEKIFVINNCISDIYQYKPIRLVSKKPVLLQIGTKPNKNLERVINAVKEIDCKLIIIGKLTENQKQSLENKNIDYKNYFDISNHQLFEKYIECNLLVFISTYEGFGMPIIEANTVGRPVITSDLEPMKSVAGNAAYLVNPFDENEIKEAIQKVLSNDSLQKELIENGLENAKKYHSEVVAQKYVELYQKIITQ